MKKPLVYIESPYAGDIKRHAEYLRLCIKNSIQRGETPFASHGFYTQFLDDMLPEERALGIELGNQWRTVCVYTVFYIDYGMTDGMNEGIKHCKLIGHPYFVRCIL